MLKFEAPQARLLHRAVFRPHFTAGFGAISGYAAVTRQTQDHASSETARKTVEAQYAMTYETGRASRSAKPATGADFYGRNG